MQWFYAQGNQQIGPVADEDFKALVRDGTIGTDTLVWREGMEQWTAYRMVSTGSPSFLRPRPQLRVATPATASCSQCGQSVPASEVVQHEGASLCPACAGTAVDAEEILQFGGFWIRFVAKLVDGLILGAVVAAIVFGGVFLILGGAAARRPGAAIGAYVVLLNLAMVLLQAAYATFFVGRFGGTPGKLALGLRIVRPDGSSVSYGRAFGRFCAEILSGLLLDVGYIMAAFDAEKRTLHDRICETRVVYKS